MQEKHNLVLHPNCDRPLIKTKLIFYIQTKTLNISTKNIWTSKYLSACLPLMVQILVAQKPSRRQKSSLTPIYIYHSSRQAADEILKLDPYHLTSTGTLILLFSIIYTGRHGLLRGPASSSCGGLWPRVFNAVLAHVRPFLVFSSNLSYFKK